MAGQLSAFAGPIVATAGTASVSAWGRRAKADHAANDRPSLRRQYKIRREDSKRRTFADGSIRRMVRVNCGAEMRPRDTFDQFLNRSHALRADANYYILQARTGRSMMSERLRVCEMREGSQSIKGPFCICRQKPIFIFHWRSEYVGVHPGVTFKPIPVVVGHTRGCSNPRMQVPE